LLIHPSHNYYLWDKFLHTAKSMKDNYEAAVTAFAASYSVLDLESIKSRGPRQRGYQSSLGRENNISFINQKAYIPFRMMGDQIKPVDVD
jgi:hypothetical protein